MTKKIMLTQGKYTLVDNEDYEWLSQWKWRWSPNGEHTGYATSRITIDGKKTCLFMHRMILGLKKGKIGDHINGNGLDNRRCNLRKCTIAQNNQNSRKQRNNSSGYIGVSWEALAKKWRARICYNGIKKQLGLFSDVEDAAMVYDRAAKKYHGEFATLNFPDE